MNNENKYEVNIANYAHSFSLANKLGRLLWSIFYWIFFKPFGLFIFNNWRNFILRGFGARIGKGSIVHASVKIWAPWNLSMGKYSCLGPGVDCYNQGKITIGDNTTISQKTYLCASSHDISDPKNHLILKPIYIHNQVWVAASSFVGPGVTIGEGAVVAATASVFKNVKEWTVVGGNPSIFFKKRIINEK